MLTDGVVFELSDGGCQLLLFMELDSAQLEARQRLPRNPERGEALPADNRDPVSPHWTAANGQLQRTDSSSERTAPMEPGPEARLVLLPRRPSFQCVL